jgi:quercetin dioxygenase-like cupin family protein
MTDGRLVGGYVSNANEGEPVWLQGGLILIKASGEQTGEQFALAEQVMPRGTTTPIHVQPDEDEMFYVLDGEMTFYLDGELIPGRAGALVCIPRGAAHGFRVESETARFLVLNTPAGHERWFRAAGAPATSLTLPTEPFDEQKMSAASADFGYTVVGPFPAA